MAASLCRKVLMNPIMTAVGRAPTLLPKMGVDVNTVPPRCRSGVRALRVSLLFTLRCAFPSNLTASQTASLGSVVCGRTETFSLVVSQTLTHATCRPDAIQSGTTATVWYLTPHRAGRPHASWLRKSATSGLADFLVLKVATQRDTIPHCSHRRPMSDPLCEDASNVFGRVSCNSSSGLVFPFSQHPTVRQLCVCGGVFGHWLPPSTVSVVTSLCTRDGESPRRPLALWKVQKRDPTVGPCKNSGAEREHVLVVLELSLHPFPMINPKMQIVRSPV